MIAPRAFLAIAIIVIAAILAVAYSPVRRGVFIWDDHALIEHNADLERLPISELVLRPLFHSSSDEAAELVTKPAYYRPVVTLSYKIDRVVFGRDPVGPHLVNVGLHAIVAALLVMVAWRLGATPAAAAMTGLLWALFPRLTESVAWISGRTDILAALFMLGALLAWPSRGGGNERWRVPIAATLIFLALLSKEVAIVGVLAIALQGSKRHLGWLAVPMILWLGLRQLVLRGVPSPPRSNAPILGTALESLGRYAEMTLDGWQPRSSIGLVGEVDLLRAVLGGLVVLGLVVLVWKRKVPFPGGAFVAAIALVLHVVPFGLNAAVVADRLLYIPLLGVALILARFVKSRLAILALAAVAVTYAPVVRARAQTYTDELAFWLEAAETAHPHNTAPRSALANELLDVAPDESCKLHASARRILEATGRRATPRHRRALGNVASCHARIGLYNEAAQAYRELLADTDVAWGWVGLGYVGLHTFQFDDARTAFSRAAERSSLAKRNLAQLPALIAETQRLETPDAKLADPAGWARLLSELGRIPEAVRAWAALILRDVPLAVRREGIDVLLHHAEPQLAAVAIDAYAAHGGDVSDVSELRVLLRARTDKHARATAARPRIAAIVLR